MSAEEASEADRSSKRIVTLGLGDILRDAGTQCRALNEEVVCDYADAWLRHASFPPIAVVRDVDRFLLVDGFHRVEGALRARVDSIDAEVTIGTRKEAVELALRANHAHGLRRSKADKHRAVEIGLKEFPQHSDRMIADLCGVSPTFVGVCRRNLTGSSATVHVDSSTAAPVAARMGKDGRVRRVPCRGAGLPAGSVEPAAAVASAELSPPVEQELRAVERELRALEARLQLFLRRHADRRCEIMSLVESHCIRMLDMLSEAQPEVDTGM